jgi:hypothetical protein
MMLGLGMTSWDSPGERHTTIDSDNRLAFASGGDESGRYAATDFITENPSSSGNLRLGGFLLPDQVPRSSISSANAELISFVTFYPFESGSFAVSDSSSLMADSVFPA